jgi:hypothetical protein
MVTSTKWRSSLSQLRPGRYRSRFCIPRPMQINLVVSFRSNPEGSRFRYFIIAYDFFCKAVLMNRVQESIRAPEVNFAMVNYGR